MKKYDSPFLRFLALVLAALLLQGIPLLFSLLPGDTGEILYFIHLYGTIPLCALLLPGWAGYGEVHPFAAFFPIGGALLLLPVYESPTVGFICLLLSLVGAVAGQEARKRKTLQKGHGHVKK